VQNWTFVSGVQLTLAGRERLFCASRLMRGQSLAAALKVALVVKSSSTPRVSAPSVLPPSMTGTCTAMSVRPSPVKSPIAGTACRL
jgi:hypothetical protein